MYPMACNGFVLFFLWVDSGIVVFLTTASLSQNIFTGPSNGISNICNLYHNASINSFTILWDTNSEWNIKVFTVFCHFKKTYNWCPIEEKYNTCVWMMSNMFSSMICINKKNQLHCIDSCLGCTQQSHFFFCITIKISPILFYKSCRMLAFVSSSTIVNLLQYFAWLSSNNGETSNSGQ